VNLDEITSLDLEKELPLNDERTSAKGTRILLAREGRDMRRNHH